MSYSVDFTNPDVAQDKILNSNDTKKMLKQLERDHSSIINQGDIYIQRRNLKEAVRIANFDN